MWQGQFIFKNLYNLLAVFCHFDSLFKFFLLRKRCYEIFFQVWPLLIYPDKNIFHCQPADRTMAIDIVSSYFSLNSF